VLGAVLLGALFLLLACGKGSDPRNATPSTQAQVPTNQPVVRPEFLKLKGQWQRPDGGYVLEIRNVDHTGLMEAGYFNPSPIKVSKALAFRDGEDTKVFVELRDAGYPGCTYSLKYDAKVDQLYGEYFQAAQQQTYDVTFGRVP